ncbi:MAG: RagB/SusD family nutrient uptake outer membrane protein [Prevotella sp.]|jgi:hypothetical protein
MKTNIRKYILMGAVACIGLSSCTGDLDVTPIDPNLTTEVTSSGLFNKCYANLGMSGNGMGDDPCDIDGIDGGTSGFIRQYWNSNELTTDEAICHWGDDGIQQYCYNTYDSNHPMLNGYYARLTTGISYCNQYLNLFESEDATKAAEIRFIRALEYYCLMDAFGNIPFSTTLSTPTRKTRAEAYEWIENELLEIEPNLSDAAPKTDANLNAYCRVDKAAAWMLLSRLYLNAEVYTGTAQWEKAAEYAKKVMDSSYKLNTTGVGNWSAYQMLFMGDNGSTSAAQEGILRIYQDGQTTTSWAGTLFLMASTFDGDMHADCSGTYPSATNGTGQAWGGNRARTDLVEKFFPNDDAPNIACTAMPAAAGDDRAIFDGLDRTMDNGDGYLGTFTDGFAVAKFNNFKTDNSTGKDATFPETDFFFFRVAEAYLTYAEATARLNGGSATAAGVEAINALRTRAHATTKAGYSLSDICDEWSREFYFEGLRRPTLIRFGRFGGNVNYNWSYKGGVKNGRNFDATRNIFAIPAAQVKGEIVQNPGY